MRGAASRPSASEKIIGEDSMSANATTQVLLGYLIPAIVVPLLGAGLLLGAFRILGNHDARFRQCWWAYLAAFVYGFFMVALAGFFLPWRSLGSWQPLAIQAAITWATHAVAVPLITRRRRGRDLIAQEGAILLANVIFTSLLFINVTQTGS
jgi:hypothetical protein